MNSVNPAGPMGHLFASVAHDPVEQILGANVQAFPKRDERLARIDEALNQARASGESLLLTEMCAAVSDYHLERGQLQEARAALLEGMVTAMAAGADCADAAIGIDRRDAWLDYLTGHPGAADRLLEVRSRAEEAGLEFDAAVCSLYLALVHSRRGRHDRVHGLVSGALGKLRSLGDTPALTRLALLGALAYAGAKQHDLAEIQALRVRAYARTNDAEPLLAASEAILEDLRSGHAMEDERVHHLVAVAIEVGRQRRLDDVLQTVVASTLDLIGAERAFVIRQDSDCSAVVASCFRDGHGGEPSQSIVSRALDEGREVIAADLGTDRRLSAAESVVSLGLRTAICVPMMDGLKVVGALYADSSEVSTEQLYESAWLVRAFAAHAVAAVRTAEYLEQTERNALRARELNHDVRNLIGSLRMGLGEIYEDAVLEEWTRTLLSELVDVAGLVQRQVTDHLAGTRQPVGRFDFGQLVGRICELMRFDGRERGVRIAFRAVGDAVMMGRIDDLTRLVSNLVANAIKYSPDDSVVEVTVAGDGRQAFLRVRDHGPGIPPLELDHIFESGVQAAGHREGHGLGLAICARLVADAGGLIRARNGEDGGAVFEVSFPNGAV